ncbi:MAG TPA: hypothetical protein H9769_09215 [Candidatus Microbacterium pullistercoris]|nr:hypothetical protein [Candidatus Microbacterium pullistercoris]
MTTTPDELARLAVSVPETVSSQNMLVTLLADFDFAHAGAVPSAAIVDVLGDFGITPAGARIALSRVARTGRLEQVRNGRQTSYRINPSGLDDREQRLRAYVEFGATGDEWDGLWTVVTFSIPEPVRGLRPKLRRELERLRFAPLTDAVWVQPHDHAARVIEIGEELGVNLAAMRATFDSQGRGGLDPVGAFPLDDVRTRYEQYRMTFEPWLPLVRADRIDAHHALVLRANVLASWRDIALTDPGLPGALLPDDWPQESVRALFVELWERLGPIALQRMRALITPHDAELASRLRVRHR